MYGAQPWGSSGPYGKAQYVSGHFGSGGSHPAETINGVSIGALGEAGTPFAGLKLVAGDDFDRMPTRWNGRNLTGRYSHSRLHNPSRRNQASGDSAVYLDPAFRGARSQSQADLGYDGLSIADSIASLIATPVTAEMLPYLPTDFETSYNGGLTTPRLFSAGLKTGPSFQFSAQADFAVAYKIKTAAGAIQGYHPAVWTNGVFWPDCGELDLNEPKKVGSQTHAETTYYVSPSDGASGAVQNTLAYNMPDDRFVTFVCRKIGTELKFYDDIAVEGTLALRATWNTNVSRMSGGHDIRIDNPVSNKWDNSTFDPTDWPAGFEIDYWQAWTPADAGNNSNIQVLTAINTTPGGSWAATLPSAASISGGADGHEEIFAAFDGADCPGAPTVQGYPLWLPGGLSVDAETRAVTGTVPATEGGRTCLMITYCYDDGTPAKRVLQPFNVAPAAQSGLFANQTADLDGSVSLTIEYTDFHSGNLGPHTYTVTSNKPWLTITGSGTDEVSISGTAPSSADVATLTISCTNAVGQTTTVERTVTAQEATPWYPSDMTSIVAWFDPSDNTTVFSDTGGTTQSIAGSTGAKRLDDKIGSADLTESTYNPTYVTDALNGMKCLMFDRDIPQRLSTTDATLLAEINGNDNGHTIIAALRRGTFAGAANRPITACRDGATEYEAVALETSGAVAFNRMGSGDGTAKTATSASTPLSSDTWYVLEIVYHGLSVTVRIDGTTVIDGAALDAGALTASRFVLGALFSFSASPQWRSGHDSAIGEVIVTSDTSTTQDTIDARNYLMSKWLP